MQLPNSEKNIWLWGLSATLVFMIATGSAIWWQVSKTNQQLRVELMIRANLVSNAIDAGLMESLSFKKGERANHEFQRMNKQLRGLASILQTGMEPAVGYCSIYSMRLRDGDIVFGPESILENDYRASSPGTVYKKPPQGLMEIFATGQLLVVGPYTDEYATFVSAFVPLIDKFGQMTKTIIGIDVMANDWRTTIFTSIVVPIGVALVTVAMLFVSMFLVRANRRIRNQHNINVSRLYIIQFAATHTLDELIEESLNQAEQLTKSSISFFHLVNDDQSSLTLQQWSTRTKTELCRAEGKGRHYPIAEAGVWADCIYKRKPIIHNNYASLPHRKGLPESHATVIRELVVPVMRGERFTAILGIGNKPIYYTEEDVRIVSQLADLIWEIVDRKQSEIALANETIRRRILLEKSRDGIVILDQNGRVYESNMKFAEMLGYSLEEMNSLSVFDWEYLFPRERLIELIRTVDEKGEYFETKHRRKDGTIYDVAISTNGSAFEGQKLVFCICRDITQQKRMEEEVKKSEAEVRNKLKTILDPEGDYGDLELENIIDLPSVRSLIEDFHRITGIAGAITDINGKILVSVGWQDICTKFHRCHHETLRNCVESNIILSSGLATGTFKTYRCKNGILDSTSPIEISGIHKGNIHFGQFFYDDETLDVERFRDQARKYGFDEEEYLAALNRVPRYNRVMIHDIMTFYSKLAQMISSLSFSTVRLARKITENKRIEEDRIRAMALLHAAIDQTPAGMLIAEAPDVTIRFANPAALGIRGESTEPLIGIPVELHPSRWLTFWPDGTPVASKDLPLSRAILNGETVKNVEVIIRRRDGEPRYVLANAAPVRNSKGEVIAGVVVFPDVTEFKLAEKELRESEKLQRTLLASLPAGVVVIDPVTRIIEKVNNTAAAMFGIQAEHIEGHRCHSFLCPANEGSCPVIDLGKEIDNAEREMLCSDGSTRPILKSVMRIQIKGQEKLLECFVDISTQKQAEEALRESEKRASLQRTAIAELVLDRIFIEGETSRALQRIIEVLSNTLGVARTSIWTMLKDSSELQCLSLFESDKKIHSSGATLNVADFPRYFEAIISENRIYAEDAQNDPRTSELTEPYLKRLGITSMLDAGIFIEGKLAGVVCCEHIGTMRNWHSDDESFISTAAAIVAQLIVNAERKRAEEGLKNSEKRFRDLAELLPQIIFETDRDGQLTYVNQIAFNTFGYTLEDFKNELNFLLMIDQKDRKKANKDFCDLIKGIHGTLTNDYLALRKDGSTFPVSSFTAPIVENNNIIGIRGIVVDITDRKRAEEQLQVSESRYRSVISVSNTGAWEFNNKSKYLWCSPEYFEMLGRNHKDFPMNGTTNLDETWINLLHPDERQRAADHFAKYLEKGSAGMYENFFRMQHADGSWIWIWSRGQTLRNPDGSLSDLTVGTHINITEQKKTEAEREKLQNQLTQAQKMETVGRLAGGVAHDFNNMLNVIMGYSAMLQNEIEHDHPHFVYLNEIQNAAKRSADLTRQLLAFARKQTIAPKVLDINEAVAGMLKMILRLIGEDIELAWKPGQDPWTIKVDPSQIDQILANLCVNARDAIAGVGKITIETDNAAFDEAYCAKHTGFFPGEYVLLAVSDNGRGMDTETLSHLFEPFFTTKETGKGTGLGLATVYGAVKQNNGFINVYSEPGFGTTFKIYIPCHSDKALQKKEELRPETSARGSETILLVEDEPAILKMIVMMLENLGYSVMAASTPGEAIRLAKEHAGQLDLLMTDVVMPEMNGRELAKNLLSIYPDIKRLFMSGYTANVIAHHGVLDEGVHFIQKPFSMDDLAAKVREALEIIGT